MNAILIKANIDLWIGCPIRMLVESSYPHHPNYIKLFVGSTFLYICDLMEQHE